MVLVVTATYLFFMKSKRIEKVRSIWSLTLFGHVTWAFEDSNFFVTFQVLYLLLFILSFYIYFLNTTAVLLELILIVCIFNSNNNAITLLSSFSEIINSHLFKGLSSWKECHLLQFNDRGTTIYETLA